MIDVGANAGGRRRGMKVRGTRTLGPQGSPALTVLRIPHVEMAMLGQTLPAHQHCTEMTETAQLLPAAHLPLDIPAMATLVAASSRRCPHLLCARRRRVLHCSMISSDGNIADDLEMASIV
jgi:hypothetical protein